MLNICIIVPKGLPVPNVNGGAIETLITDIINQNEIEKKLKITVYSIYDEKVENEISKYRMTKFRYIKNNLKYKIKAILVRFKNLFGKNLNTYNEMILDEIKKEKFDYILVEDGAFFSFKTYLKYYNKKQMILHFHHNGKSDKVTDETYSTFIGVSDFVVNTFKKSSSINDCKTLKNGINLARFDRELPIEEKSEIRKKMRFNNDDFVIIFCGRLIKEKGVLELIKAIKQIDDPKIKLMIVGAINFGNSQTSEYVEILNQEILNSNGRINTTGYIKYDDVYKYYKVADVAVIPSICEDAAPLVNIEAMASGLPIIITNSGGAPEYVSNQSIVISRKKLIENIKEKILLLYNDENKRKKMKEEGLKTAKIYSTKEFYKNFVRIFEDKERNNE